MCEQKNRTNQTEQVAKIWMKIRIIRLLASSIISASHIKKHESNFCTICEILWIVLFLFLTLVFVCSILYNEKFYLKLIQPFYLRTVARYYVTGHYRSTYLFRSKQPSGRSCSYLLPLRRWGEEYDVTILIWDNNMWQINNKCETIAIKIVKN